MAWLEFTIETTPQSIDSAVTALSARGFSDLVIEDQSEFETFLEENRAYWDYIDEGLQKSFRGFPGSSCIWRTPTITVGSVWTRR